MCTGAHNRYMTGLRFKRWSFQEAAGAKGEVGKQRPSTTTNTKWGYYMWSTKLGSVDRQQGSGWRELQSEKGELKVFCSQRRKSPHKSWTWATESGVYEASLKVPSAVLMGLLGILSQPSWVESRRRDWMESPEESLSVKPALLTQEKSLSTECSDALPFDHSAVSPWSPKRQYGQRQTRHSQKRMRTRTSNGVIRSSISPDSQLWEPEELPISLSLSSSAGTGRYYLPSKGAKDKNDITHGETQSTRVTIETG